eukprot:scaffold50307_cov28-Tisochrysis_lutea.AAC.1
MPVKTVESTKSSRQGTGGARPGRRCPRACRTGLQKRVPRRPPRVRWVPRRPRERGKKRGREREKRRALQRERERRELRALGGGQAVRAGRSEAAWASQDPPHRPPIAQGLRRPGRAAASRRRPSLREGERTTPTSKHGGHAEDLAVRENSSAFT